MNKQEFMVQFFEEQKEAENKIFAWIYCCHHKLSKIPAEMTSSNQEWFHSKEKGFFKEATFKEQRALDLTEFNFSGFSRAEKVDFFREKLRQAGYYCDHEALAKYEGYQAGEISKTTKSGLRLWTEKNKKSGKFNYCVTELWVKGQDSYQQERAEIVWKLDKSLSDEDL